MHRFKIGLQSVKFSLIKGGLSHYSGWCVGSAINVNAEGRGDMQLCTINQCDATSPDDECVGVMNVISLV